MSYKVENTRWFGSPTTEAVGSNFVTSLKPPALVVGAQSIKRQNPIQCYLWDSLATKKRGCSDFWDSLFWI